MALANGRGPDEPKTIWRQLRDWTAFGALLTRLLAAGLWQWLTQRALAKH